MKILVFSDSHGRSDRLGKAFALNRDADVILHLGDGYGDLRYLKLPDIPVYAVKGNGEDWLSMRGDGVPRERFLTFEGISFLMMHGHTHAVKSGFDRAAKYAIDLGADVLLFGHTHGAVDKFIPAGSELGFGKAEKDIRIFNPGSIGEPKFGAPKFGLITIKNGSVLMSHGELD